MAFSLIAWGQSQDLCIRDTNLVYAQFIKGKDRRIGQRHNPFGPLFKAQGIWKALFLQAFRIGKDEGALPLEDSETDSFKEQPAKERYRGSK